MSDTPRTDASERKWSGLSNFHSICVNSDFARQLERELNESESNLSTTARVLCCRDDTIDQLRAEVERLEFELATAENNKAEARADAERLREALYESWALNTNVFSTAEPELSSYYSEHKKVIKMGSEALAAHAALKGTK